MLYFFSVPGIARKGIEPYLGDGLIGVLILSQSVLSSVADKGPTAEKTAKEDRWNGRFIPANY